MDHPSFSAGHLAVPYKTSVVAQKKEMAVLPLKWPEQWEHRSQLDRFLVDIPLLGLNAKVHRELCNQMRCRSIECLRLWGDHVDRFRTLCFLSPIVKEYGRWPNCYFIPDDPCEILFWDPTSELLAVEALGKIHAELSLPKDMTDDLPNLTYRELVDRVTRFVQFEAIKRDRSNIGGVKGDKSNKRRDA